MQVLLIRHALPLRHDEGEGSDPELSDTGARQAQRVPRALERHTVSRVISSPQRRAVQTAVPTAEALGLTVEIDDRLAEYDQHLGCYVPIEQVREENPAQWARLADGLLPIGVDEEAFTDRVVAAIDDVVATAQSTDTVAIFSHGGVINALLHRVLGTARLVSFAVDYASLTQLVYSRSGRAGVKSVNGVEHVWDLLPTKATS